MTLYADWKAPKSDQEHLIWPAPDRIVESTLRNTAALAKLDDVRLLGVPVSRLRSDARKLLGAGDEPLIATGHQIEMYHPGVWVKNVLIDQIARKASGRAVHLAVDTDTPKHLQLRWPGGSVLMSDDAGILDAGWSGLVSPPTERHYQKMCATFRSAADSWAFEPAMDSFFSGFSRSLGAPTLAAAIIEGATELDQSLGLDVQFAIIDLLIDSDAYLAMAYHIIADIERFAVAYNTALAEYRQREGISSPSRPMPDLRIETDRIELPFWTDDLQSQDRARAVAVRVGAVWALDAGDGGEPLHFDPAQDAYAAAAALRAFLLAHQIRLSPRALTLTMFFRLLLVDQFVHGIGGARYDQVTDRILADYFRLAPPAFSVTTGTLFFPGGAGPSDVCVPCIVSEGHRLRHNVLESKTQYLTSITSAPRKSMQRRQHYLAMHRDLTQAAGVSQRISEWRQRLAATIERQERELVLADRELFYGLQTRERLTAMIDRYRIAFG
ncbi:MAG: hypothetical protein H7144_07725 [Burkholderiales bacterium]|nr:hypothetical protein [Phycisphaerae bacterium]